VVRARRVGGARVGVLVVCASVGLAATVAACARALDDASAARAGRAFADGVAAYGAGQSSARGRRSAPPRPPRRAPPDAWADAGTAAWAAADTVGAAVAWHRALRLEPTAADMRERLALLPAAQDGMVAGVLPVPADAPAVVALGLSALAALLALPGARRRAGSALWAVVWGASLAAGAGSWALAAHLRADALAVVAAGSALRAEPGIDAEPGPRADITDLARVAARSGVWTHVRLDGGREGWIASDRSCRSSGRRSVRATPARPAGRARFAACPASPSSRPPSPTRSPPARWSSARRRW
jgi:hypothetical protein